MRRQSNYSDRIDRGKLQRIDEEDDYDKADVNELKKLKSKLGMIPRFYVWCKQKCTE